MTKNNPHHSYCSNPIKDIEILALSDFEYFHVADKIETFEPFVFPLAFVALYCCSNDEEQDDCENEGCYIGKPVHGIHIILCIGVNRGDVVWRR